MPNHGLEPEVALLAGKFEAMKEPPRWRDQVCCNCGASLPRRGNPAHRWETIRNYRYVVFYACLRCVRDADLIRMFRVSLRNQR